MIIQPKSKTIDASEDGFSLVEALLVTVLMLIVFTAFGSFLMRFQKSAAECTQDQPGSPSALGEHQPGGRLRIQRWYSGSRADARRARARRGISR